MSVLPRSAGVPAALGGAHVEHILAAGGIATTDAVTWLPSLWVVPYDTAELAKHVPSTSTVVNPSGAALQHAFAHLVAPLLGALYANVSTATAHPLPPLRHLLITRGTPAGGETGATTPGGSRVPPLTGRLQRELLALSLAAAELGGGTGPQRSDDAAAAHAATQGLLQWAVDAVAACCRVTDDSLLSAPACTHRITTCLATRRCDACPTLTNATVPWSLYAAATAPLPAQEGEQSGGGTRVWQRSAPLHNSTAPADVVPRITAAWLVTAAHTLVSEAAARDDISSIRGGTKTVVALNSTLLASLAAHPPASEVSSNMPAGGLLCAERLVAVGPRPAGMGGAAEGEFMRRLVLAAAAGKRARVEATAPASSPVRALVFDVGRSDTADYVDTETGRWPRGPYIVNLADVTRLLDARNISYDTLTDADLESQPLPALLATIAAAQLLILPHAPAALTLALFAPARAALVHLLPFGVYEPAATAAHVAAGHAVFPVYSRLKAPNMDYGAAVAADADAHHHLHNMRLLLSRECEYASLRERASNPACRHEYTSSAVQVDVHAAEAALLQALEVLGVPTAASDTAYGKLAGVAEPPPGSLDLNLILAPDPRIHAQRAWSLIPPSQSPTPRPTPSPGGSPAYAIVRDADGRPIAPM